MIVILSILLLLCVAGVLHTYVLYPRYVVNLARTRVQSKNGREQGPAGQWPIVKVLMAAHNEEAVLEKKLETLSAQDYPGEMIFYVGSDNSCDRTNEIIATYAEREPRLRPVIFTERRGKPGVINHLAHLSGHDGIFVLTDASVMLRANAITEMVRPMRHDATVGIVDTTMVQVGGNEHGIGGTESRYIDGEVAVKRAEGQLWGAMIGPFGGCFALRGSCYRPVPDNFLVDDFYLCMCTYEQGFRGLSSAAAVVEEPVGQHLRDEFRRKVRISSGNWQNLVRFQHLWWPPGKTELAFALFSHKILRWWTPFLLLTGAGAWLALYLLTGNYWVGALLAITSATVLGMAVLDIFLSELNVHLRALRAMRYFLAMNAALLAGFYRYLTGIRTNVWQPSNRN